MEQEKKKRPGIASIICWIIAVCLILTGIIVPQVRSQKENYTFSVDDDGFGSFYEFKIEIDESINPDMAYAKIKLYEKGTKSFKLNYNSDVSEYGDYLFILNIPSEDAHIFNEVVELELTTTSGKVLTLKEESVFDDFGSKTSIIILTVVPIFFGVFFIMVGFVLLFVRRHAKHIKRVNEKIMDKVFGIESEEPKVQIVEKEPSTITCKYCGIENSPENAKCEHCGAPLIRNKK